MARRNAASLRRYAHFLQNAASAEAGVPVREHQEVVLEPAVAHPPAQRLPLGVVRRTSTFGESALPAGLDDLPPEGGVLAPPRELLVEPGGLVERGPAVEDVAALEERPRFVDQAPRVPVRQRVGIHARRELCPPLGDTDGRVREGREAAFEPLRIGDDVVVDERDDRRASRTPSQVARGAGPPLCEVRSALAVHGTISGRRGEHGVDLGVVRAVVDHDELPPFRCERLTGERALVSRRRRSARR